MKTTLVSAARALTIVAAAILGCNAAGASADTSTSVSTAGAAPTYVVHYGDLDLSRIAGANKLYARIRHAATVVCEPQKRWDGMNDLYRTCMKSAIDNAVASVNRPLVSQVHLTRTNRLVRLSAAN